jgi:hypothetical protein
VTHGRGRGEAGHAPEHGCDGGGGACCGGDGSRVCGGGEDKSAGRPAQIWAAATELDGRGGRGGSAGRRADRIGIARWGGHAHAREDVKRARFSIWAQAWTLEAHTRTHERM